MRMGVIGECGRVGVRPGSLRFRHQPRLVQPRFRCWGGLPVSTPGWKGTTSWVRGLVAPVGNQHLGVRMGSMSECTTSIVVCLYIGCVGVFMCTHEGGNVRL
ncbi:hypothetical protein ATANTOWER_028071 [Ataeniobius toweri]|uniref:Uncharacterized protein n=1 Tax=Ataeniobius toweri TaxID=208326 RepID=A0ABU7B1U6_9TELE|nr:hypothetical protein [Ataeniobius toweri]